MLSKAIAYLELQSADVLYIRKMMREGQPVYKIEAKTKQGKTELFQLRGMNLWHHKVTLGKGIEEKLIFQFSDSK
ncbi:hypothetical protein HCG83_06420 [Enterococcus casseliflavus]|uniref:hypothetical protein n=1 Tax=Enterococcus casseliflavus TaxID=37734 RepID=UPI001C8BC615|nr:hypothetical protein [Enterococcus casseliflavus]MBX9115944.1 hypothetical protein [Enterococcus casseliflavus]MBX9126326.1 hypothetical protein [Enterococcus casseliflavus]